MTIPVIIKGLKNKLPETYDALCTQIPIEQKRISDTGEVETYVYLEIDAEFVARFADQNEYNQWRDKNGQFTEEDV